MFEIFYIYMDSYYLEFLITYQHVLYFVFHAEIIFMTKF